MAPDDPLKAPGKCVDIEPPGHAEGAGHVVGGQAGFELIEEPETLLGKGERVWSCVSSARDRCLRRSLPDLPAAFAQLLDNQPPLGAGEMIDLFGHERSPCVRTRYNSSSEASASIASSIKPASPAIVGASNKLLTGRSMPIAWPRRETSWRAVRESPPRSKKLSWMPMRRMPKTSCQITVISCSRSSDGGT